MLRHNSGAFAKEQSGLRSGVSQHDCSVVGSDRLFSSTSFSEEMCPSCVKVAIVTEFGSQRRSVHGIEAGLPTVRHSYGDRSVQRHHRSRLDGFQATIEQFDLCPVGLGR